MLEDKTIKDLLQYTRSHLIKEEKQFPFWDLDKVLEMFQSKQFNSLCSVKPDLYFKKVLFLTILAVPRRIEEIKAISISRSTFKESEMILRPHAKFIKKNASATFNPQEIKIPKFTENPAICPIYNLQQYLEITNKICSNKNQVRPDQLFIKSDSSPFSTHQLRSSIREIIFRADPFSNKSTSTPHSIRKTAATILDYRGFTLRDIMNQMQWRSSETYMKYYCQIGLVPNTSRSCVIAGNIIPST